MIKDKLALDELRSEGDLNISPLRREWAASHVGEAAKALLDRDANVFLHQSLSTPCLNALKSCRGSELEDLEGRRLLDFHGNNVHQVGFGNEAVIEAVIRQLRTLPFCPRRYTNDVAVQLAERLVEAAPGDLSRVLFAPGGTSAIGMAMKLARAATGRFKMVSMWDSFHGASLDAISVGGEAIFRKGAGPLLPGCEHVPPPDSTHCVFGCAGSCNLRCADYINYVLEKEGDVAAVIGETVRCTPFIPPPDYWKRVRAACDKHGALLILDEIPICLGRTGKLFACEHFGVVPDILVLGKGLGGGVLPLAAMLAREHLNVAQDRALGHYTHEKNPVACAAGLATLDYLRDNQLVAHSAALGELAMARMREMRGRHQRIGDVRGLGLLMGIELVKSRATLERDTDGAERVMYYCLSHGLNFKLTMGNILTLTPPLTITREDLARAFDIIEAAITALGPVVD